MTARVAAGMFLFAMACGTAQPRPPMSQGERLYRAKCSACHRLYEPGRYAPQTWAKAMAMMEREKRVHLAAEERADILAYLQGNVAP